MKREIKDEVGKRPCRAVFYCGVNPVHAFLPDAQGDRMTTLQIALVSFAAGFLSCTALAASLVFWSLADRQIRGTDSTTKPQQQRAA